MVAAPGGWEDEENGEREKGAPVGERARRAEGPAADWVAWDEALAACAAEPSGRGTAEPEAGNEGKLSLEGAAVAATEDVVALV